MLLIYTELKKDPGVPRLPNLKVRSAEKQRGRSVRSPHLHPPSVNTRALSHTVLVAHLISVPPTAATS